MLRAVPLCLLICCVAPFDASAQTGGTPEELVSVREGVFSIQQVEKGNELFDTACLYCHQPEQFIGAGFIDAWSGRPVDALLEQIRTTMPQDNPGKLKKSEYVALIAYLFKRNGLPEGESDMPTSSRQLKQIRIEPALSDEKMR